MSRHQENWSFVLCVCVCVCVCAHLGFLGSSDGKESPAMQETRVWSLGQKDPLEKGTATHSSILAWKIPDKGGWWATVYGVAESDMTEQLTHTHMEIAVSYST